MSRVLWLIPLCVLLASCTSSRWVVTDQFALDERAEPAVLGTEHVLLVEGHPTPENPTITFAAYELTEREFPLRVKMERSVQKYRPSWKFITLGAAGAAFSFLAANSDIVLPQASRSQRTTLNISGGVISALSLVHMRPRGEPIFTGESELLRRSGVEVIRDSVRFAEEDDQIADLRITFEGDELFSQQNVEMTNSTFEMNLASLTSDLQQRATDQSVVEIELDYRDYKKQVEVPVADFLSPFIHITEPVALLRNSPAVSDINVITEIGRGSYLEILEETGEWLLVRYEELEAYIRESDGNMEWMASAESSSSLIFEFAELPFGEIDVENRVPVLKSGNAADRALILTNGIDNQLGIRQYLDRDHQLFEHYMKTALQMDQSQVVTIAEQGGRELQEELAGIQPLEADGALYVYLSGFATLRNNDGREEIMMIYRDEDGEEISTPLTSLFEVIAGLQAEKIFVFVDVDYSAAGRSRNGNGAGALQRASEVITRSNPSSAVIFSNRPGQHSGLYTGVVDGNMRHHIFNYFWADAIKNRRIQISEMIDHLEDNVDYTSRRLHDRAQEIRAFGNFSLNLAR